MLAATLPHMHSGWSLSCDTEAQPPVKRIRRAGHPQQHAVLVQQEDPGRPRKVPVPRRRRDPEQLACWLEEQLRADFYLDESSPESLRQLGRRVAMLEELHALRPQDATVSCYLQRLRVVAQRCSLRWRMQHTGTVVAVAPPQATHHSRHLRPEEEWSMRTATTTTTTTTTAVPSTAPSVSSLAQLLAAHHQSCNSASRLSPTTSAAAAAAQLMLERSCSSSSSLESLRMPAPAPPAAKLTLSNLNRMGLRSVTRQERWQTINRWRRDVAVATYPPQSMPS